jgi:FkbH-like protein
MDVTIYSNYHLLPTNPAWNIFRDEDVKIDFGGYGEIAGVVKRCDLLVDVLFLTDSEDLNKLAYVELIEKRYMAMGAGNYLLWIFDSSVQSPWNQRLRYRGLYDCSLLIKWLRALQERTSNFTLYYIPTSERHLFGFGSIEDTRNRYLMGLPLSVKGLRKLALEIKRFINVLTRPRIKLLVLDCDNTLWGGIIGEDGPAAIDLTTDCVGKSFRDFQCALLELRKTGVMLALASKNNLADAQTAFRDNPDMILEWGHFVTHRINWEPKSANIYSIATELNIGIESVAFWDDNPIERSEVSLNLPKCVVLDIPESTLEWVSYLNEQEIFSYFSLTESDLRKQEMYAAKLRYDEDQKSMVTNSDDFLRQIGMMPRICKVTESDLVRAHQLLQKTNQFNLTSRRPSASEFRVYLESSECIFYRVDLEDRYGDHGFIALVGTHRAEGFGVLITDFVMSCRVLGRRLEHWIVNKLLEDIKSTGHYEKVYGIVRRNIRNTPVHELYRTLGFSLVDSRSREYGIVWDLMENSGITCTDDELFSLSPTHYKFIYGSLFREK